MLHPPACLAEEGAHFSFLLESPWLTATDDEMSISGY